MLEIIIGIVAILGLGVSLALVARLRHLEDRFDATHLAMKASSQRILSTPAQETTSPLHGLRIALAITQDHAHPVFANLLKEQLLKADVTDVETLTPEELKNSQTIHDILISGDLVCNGYAEIYFQADFICQTQTEPICTLIERPPHGDRPGNLAIELVTKLKVELEKALSRQERRQAIRELRD